MVKHNKLVRDNIPSIIQKDGKKANVRILDDKEFLNSLKIKLVEEVNEYLESDDIDEIADILEVIYSLLDFNDISF